MAVEDINQRQARLLPPLVQSQTLTTFNIVVSFRNYMLTRTKKVGIFHYLYLVNKCALQAGGPPRFGHKDRGDHGQQEVAKGVRGGEAGSSRRWDKE